MVFRAAQKTTSANPTSEKCGFVVLYLNICCSSGAAVVYLPPAQCCWHALELRDWSFWHAGCVPSWAVMPQGRGRHGHSVDESVGWALRESCAKAHMQPQWCDFGCVCGTQTCLLLCCTVYVDRSQVVWCIIKAVGRNFSPPTRGARPDLRITLQIGDGVHQYILY